MLRPIIPVRVSCGWLWLFVGVWVAMLTGRAAAAGAPAPASNDTVDRSAATALIENLRHIGTPEGIEELRPVTLGGVTQWVSIRGRNRNNPVLLVIHGGPATPLMPFAWAFQSPWEDYFTVVQWDQRGGGKNAVADLPDSLKASLTLERVVADGVELVDYLRGYLGKDKISILGFSWGTAVGTLIAQQVPSKLSAYVAVGQFVATTGEREVYDATVVAARRAGDGPSLETLKSLEPYPGDSGTPSYEAAYQVRTIAVRYGLWYGHSDFSLLDRVPLLAPEYSLDDVQASRVAQGAVGGVLYESLKGTDLRQRVPALDVPVVMIMGRQDLFTPYRLARSYFDALRAPQKRFVSFERSAHFVMLEEPGRFLTTLVTAVLPLTEGSPSFSPDQ